MFVVAYFVPHNEGIESGIIDGPGFDAGFVLIDIHEVDASIESFPDQASAEAWLKAKHAEMESDLDLEAVAGGSISTVEL